MKPVQFCGCIVTFCIFICGCFSHSRTNSYPDNLTNDALDTYINWVKKESGKEINNQIPPVLWTRSLKALHPLKVYVHRGNVVIVEKVVGETETGKYVTIFVSSYYPQSGDDGFEFSQTHNKMIYTFKRIKTE